jgi:hypothetical protein
MGYTSCIVMQELARDLKQRIHKGIHCTRAAR